MNQGESAGAHGQPDTFIAIQEACRQPPPVRPPMPQNRLEPHAKGEQAAGESAFLQAADSITTDVEGMTRTSQGTRSKSASRQVC